MPAWLKTVERWLPECVAAQLRNVVTSLLHLAAVAMGGTLCALSAWDVIVEKHGFNAISFGTAAANIILAWGVLVKFWPDAKPEKQEV